MRCPSCQVEAPDGQFYCPNCRASMYSYVPESSHSKGGRLERAGRRLLDLLLILILIGVGIVLARAIKWKEVFNGFKPMAEMSPSSKPGRDPTDSGGKRRTAGSSAKDSTGTPASSVKSSSAERMRENQKTKEPASSDNPKTTPKPAAVTPTPTPKEPNSIKSPTTLG